MRVIFYLLPKTIFYFLKCVFYFGTKFGLQKLNQADCQSFINRKFRFTDVFAEAVLFSEFSNNDNVNNTQSSKNRKNMNQVKE